jgi:rod shape determining protein RodA
MLLRIIRNMDKPLLIATLLLTIAGVMVLYATTVKAAGVGTDVDALNQMIFAGLGIAVVAALTAIDYRLWLRLTGFAYAASIFLLILVDIAGQTALGAQRWIDIGFFRFQPSELVKIVLILVLAKLLSQNYDRLEQPKYLLQSILLTGLPVMLVLAQPDLGTALVLLAIWFMMILVSPIPKGYVLALAVAGILFVPIGITMLQPYQRDRLTVFINPAADPLGRGFNVVQASIAVGSGQLFGRGLAAGSQSQLNFLPSQHTDFIFAVWAEKLGFVGTILMLALFTLLITRIIIVANRSRDRFGMFVCVGIATMLLFHILVNVGMNMGIMPVTGIPLPFISYGGTSLIVALAAIGLVQSVAVRHKKISF